MLGGSAYTTTPHSISASHFRWGPSGGVDFHEVLRNDLAQVQPLSDQIEPAHFSQRDVSQRGILPVPGGVSGDPQSGSGRRIKAIVISDAQVQECQVWKMLFEQVGSEKDGSAGDGVGRQLQLHQAAICRMSQSVENLSSALIGDAVGE